MNGLLPDEVVCQAYRELRDRVVTLLDDLDESDAGRPVSACPGWTVRALVSHLVGVPEDVLVGRLDGLTTEAWTGAQVERHAHETLAELRDRFVEVTAELDPLLEQFDAPINSQFVMDAVTHEHDLRDAVDRPGAEDSTAVAVALAWLRWFTRLPAGTPPDGVSDFVVMRALSGRIPVSEMRALVLPADQIVAALAGSPLVPPD